MAAQSRIVVLDTSLPGGLVTGPALLCLPAELRNQIWKHTLSGVVFEVYCWPSHEAKKVATRVLNRQKNFLSLLGTCRQVHGEAKLFPFKFNAFHIRKEQALSAFLDRFETPKREAIAEVHLATWRAMYMVENLNYFPTPLPDILVPSRLPGLKKLCVEVRVKSDCQDCRHGYCNSCNTELGMAEEHLLEHVARENRSVEVVFRRTFYASIAALRVL